MPIGATRNIIFLSIPDAFAKVCDDNQVSPGQALAKFMADATRADTGTGVHGREHAAAWFRIAAQTAQAERTRARARRKDNPVSVLRPGANPIQHAISAWTARLRLAPDAWRELAAVLGVSAEHVRTWATSEPHAAKHPTAARMRAYEERVAAAEAMLHVDTDMNRFTALACSSSGRSSEARLPRR